MCIQNICFHGEIRKNECRKKKSQEKSQRKKGTDLGRKKVTRCTKHFEFAILFHKYYVN